MLSRRAFLAGSVALAAQPAKQNLIILLADDMGYGDIGCYGSPDVPTPHIDSLTKPAPASPTPTSPAPSAAPPAPPSSPASTNTASAMSSTPAPSNAKPKSTSASRPTRASSPTT